MDKMAIRIRSRMVDPAQEDCPPGCRIRYRHNVDGTGKRREAFPLGNEHRGGYGGVWGEGRNVGASWEEMMRWK